MSDPVILCEIAIKILTQAACINYIKWITAVCFAKNFLFAVVKLCQRYSNKK